ncbi:rod shape-determining protein MreC [Stigmatella aurantiaca]|uniref:Cell shape-determining protein MreC n=1 Tax=Stigmatella aurantiaca (strain DW4/3-1) TaxID=378806 RepID=Q08TQ0_STIAD|nr:rod shape-determining protein MreC [Stigmatella aurantiaca]ADO71171.1 Rod shape-determining protein MreC [Stigmatella aurantiaca DW4/3-1]EAU63855.1 rod shape-determining protein MreC [Stigmatella aurantiaca DW4/3-1]
MLSLLKRYRQLLLVSALLLFPLVAFLASGRRGREPNFIDRAVIALTSPLQSGLNWIIDGGVGLVNGYVDLRGVRRENDALRLENMQLRAAVQLLGEARTENERLRQLLGYTEAVPGPEIPARVVGVNPVAKLLSVRISSGEKQGVFEGMSVVTPDGIVGRVIRTTGHYADVALVTDPQSRVGVRVQRSRARGTAAGSGSGPLLLENMLRTEDVENGDLIITSGTDGVYPPGMVVGRVTNLEKKEHGMFQGADIVPAVDTTKLEEVLVVGSPYGVAAQSVEGGTR